MRNAAYAFAQQLQPDTLRQQSIRPLETNTMTEQNLSTHDLLPAGSDTPVAAPKTKYHKQQLKQNH